MICLLKRCVPKTLQPKVIHPFDHSRHLILFFDIVHIIKSIRNNWLNQQNHDKVFIFPLFDECNTGENDHTSAIPITKSLCVSIPISEVFIHTNEHPSLHPTICTAVFEDIRLLFKSDMYSILKRAPKFTTKACWPSRLERQNVKLALKIFHGSTFCGLLSSKIDKGIVEDNQTVEFLKLISSIWDIFNVNWVGKDIRLKNDFSAPLCQNDFRFDFLRQVIHWLDCWKRLPIEAGKLTPQTFSSFKHTCMALPFLVDRLTSECNFSYLLSARIQNDPLEHHFGLYRQMSGSHYHITYCQILESERKLQLSNILKLFAIKLATKNEKPLSLKDYLNKFAENIIDEYSEINFDPQF